MRLTAVFLAGLAVQESVDSLPDAVKAFVAGDDAKGTPIRAAGPGALRELRPHRGTPRVDALIRSLREAAATVEDRKLARALEAHTPDFKDEKSGFFDALDVALEDIPYLIDPSVCQALSKREVRTPEGGNGREALEGLCAQVDADFAFLAGAVVIAPPDRLWPPATASRLLTENERARAESWVGKLGAAALEERDRAAAELRKLGDGALPLLQRRFTDPDPEVAGRCRALEAELRRKPVGFFGPPAAAGQDLAGDDAALFEQWKTLGATVQIQGLSLRNTLTLLLNQFQVPHEIEEGADPSLHVRFAQVPFSTLLAVVTQAAGMDYRIAGGKLLIGPRPKK